MIEKMPRNTSFVGAEQVELVDVINEIIEEVNRLSELNKDKE